MESYPEEMSLPNFSQNIYNIIRMDMEGEEIIYRIALGMMRGTNASLARRIVERGLTLKEFFTLDLLSVSDALGLNSRSGFGAYDRNEALSRARQEYEFTSRHSVRVLSLVDDDYPWLLGEIPDAPVTLYMLGNADLNSPHSALSSCCQCIHTFDYGTRI